MAIEKEVNTEKEKEELMENEIMGTAKSWFAIDTYMLSSKISYILVLAKQSYSPYMILYLTSIGLNPSEAGIITGFRFLGTLIGAPIWGYIADYKNMHRVLITILCLLSILFTCSQPFISYPIAKKDINVCPYTGNISFTKLNVHTKNTNLFYTMLSINIMSALFDGSIIGFVDSAVIQKINLGQTTRYFGHQRWVGALGFGGGTVISSQAVEYLPSMAVSCYSAVFLVYFISMLFLVISLQFLFRNLSYKRSKRTKTYKIKSLLRKTLSRMHVVIFFVTVLIMGAEQGLYIGFTFIHLKNMDAPNILLGLCIAVAELGCVFSFFYSSRIIQLLGGTSKTMALCCFSFFIRYISFAYLKYVWYVLLIQLLHAIGFGLTRTTIVLHVKEISSPLILTTMYTITTAIYFGLGPFIVNISGGYVYKVYGGPTLFIAGAIVALCWSIVLAIVSFKTVMLTGDSATGSAHQNNKDETEMNIID